MKNAKLEIISLFSTVELRETEKKISKRVCIPFDLQVEPLYHHIVQNVSLTPPKEFLTENYRSIIADTVLIYL